MSEVSFAQAFLAILESKPSKLLADHVEDPRSYPARMPYILPRLPNPMTKPSSFTMMSPSEPSLHLTAKNPGIEPSCITVMVRSMGRSSGAPAIDMTLPAQPLVSTSALDVKAEIARRTGLPIQKLRLLHNKRPVGDTKSLRDIVLAGGSGKEGGGGNGLEITVMVLGGATMATAQVGIKKEREEDRRNASSGVAQCGQGGAAVLETEAFWEDLRGFLLQRTRDEELVKKLVGKWREGLGKR